jgi:hypothetical protein
MTRSSEGRDRSLAARSLSRFLASSCAFALDVENRATTTSLPKRVYSGFIMVYLYGEIRTGNLLFLWKWGSNDDFNHHLAV